MSPSARSTFHGERHEFADGASTIVAAFMSSLRSSGKASTSSKGRKFSKGLARTPASLQPP